MSKLSDVFLLISFICYGIVAFFYILIFVLNVIEKISNISEKIFKGDTEEKIYCLKEIKNKEELTGKEIPIGNNWYAIYK